MDKGKIQELREFFEKRCSHLDPLERQREAERLTDSIRGTVEHLQEKERCRQRDAKCIEGALRKIDLALEELDDATGPEAERMRESLHKLQAEAGTPVQKEPTERIYIDAFNETAHSVETDRKTEFPAHGDRAECLSKLWLFWVREFGERPGKHPRHPFFELAGIVLPNGSEDPDNRTEAAYRLWLRNARQ